MIEHVLHCHPVIYTILSNILNLMIATSYIPASFCLGLMVPIPKEENLQGPQKIENFRGITLSPVVSKIYEYCLMNLFQAYLYTCDNQFGFKPKLGCTHAIYTMRTIVDYYVANDTTVKLCFLDVSKAFDKLNHYVLFNKLMKRGTPITFIKILFNWYSSINICVQWHHVLSRTFKVTAGVRQGGILSSSLFLIYVDEMLIKLRSHGCTFFGHPVGAIMYADDLTLISPSVEMLQFMLSLCENELAQLDLKINNTKSVCLRIGKRFDVNCCDLKTETGVLPWKSETRYLGLYLVAATKLKNCM